MEAEAVKDRAMDFAYRMCFKGYPELTGHRKQRLWDEVGRFLEHCFVQLGATGWQTNPTDAGYPCDEFREYFIDFDVTDREFQRGKENVFFMMLSAIARSAFDSIEDFPGGVFGFTVGDLKRMYNGSIPPWIARGWRDRKGRFISLRDPRWDAEIIPL